MKNMNDLLLGLELFYRSSNCYISIFNMKDNNIFWSCSNDFSAFFKEVFQRPYIKFGDKPKIFLINGLERDLDVSIITPTEEIKALKEGEYLIENQKRKTFSVFAFGCDTADVSYEGAKYPLNHYKMKAAYPIGISNIFTENKAIIKIHSGTVLYVRNKYEI